MHTKHSMHKGWRKPVAHKCVVLLMRYKIVWMVINLFWEQEVGGSNPLAPTMLRLSGYAWQASLRFRAERKNEGYRVEARGVGGPILWCTIKATARHAFASRWHLKRNMGWNFITLTSYNRSKDLIDFMSVLLSISSHASNPITEGKIPIHQNTSPGESKRPIAFSDRQRAVDFEEYLKSPSGRAFSKKRLWSSWGQWLTFS